MAADIPIQAAIRWHGNKRPNTSRYDNNAVKLIGREGTVELIDDLGQLHGTWGGLAVIVEQDEIEILPR